MGTFDPSAVWYGIRPYNMVSYNLSAYETQP